VAAGRAAAERLRRAAPPADGTWEYASSKLADPAALSHILEFDGHRLQLDQTQLGIEVDENARRIHVRVFHPAFAGMSDNARGHISFLLLDWLVGEDNVARWIGAVEFPDTPPADARPAAELATVLRELADARKHDSWAIAELTDRSGASVVVRFRTDVRWIDHPTFDLHHTVVIRYPKEANGMPRPGTMEPLELLEDSLERAVEGRGVVIAYETGAGARTVHLYTDGDDQNVTEQVKAAVKSVRAKMRSDIDPQWQAVGMYTG
jgi:hypothetical protein